jgi:hypothetical protein
LLDDLLFRHLILQAVRIACAGGLFFILASAGAAILRLMRIAIEERIERLLLSVATGFAVFQCLVRWAAELPIVSRAGVLALTCAFALAAFREWRGVFDDIRALRWPHRWESIAVLALATPAFFMALAPAVSRDALIYHLRFPEMTLRAGTWTYDVAASTSHYPAAMGTLYLPALALDRQGVIAQLLHFGFFLLTIVAIAAVARRLGAAHGWFAGLLFASLPAAGVVAGWAWADAPLLFAFAASALATLAGVPVVGIALLGLAASVKYTALPAGVMLFLAAVAPLVRARRLRDLAWASVLGLAIMSPWYVTNAIRKGNPIYPLGDSTQPATRIVTTWSSDAGSWAKVWSDYFVRPQALDEDIGGLLFLALALPALVIAFRARGQLRLAAIVAVAMWLPFLPFTAAMRLLLPAAAAVMVVAGIALESHVRRPLAVAAVVVFCLRGGLVTAAHNTHFFNPLPAAVGVESEAAYVHRKFPPSALYERADRELPAGARVLAFNEVRLFRFPRTVLASRVHDQPVIRRYVAGARDVRAAVARLRADGITHLLIAREPVERGTGAPLTPQEARLFRETIHASRIIDREGDVALFALP